MSISSLTAEKLFPLLLENLQDYALFMMDIQGTIVAWMPGVEHLFGYEEDEFVGRNADLIFTPEDRAAGLPAQELKSAALAGRAEDVRWHVRKDGTRFWANGQVIGLYDSEQQLQGFAKLLRDDTARKRTEDTLEETQDRLENALAEGGIATWQYDILNDRLYADVNLQRLFGVSDEDANGGPLERYLRVIHPQDLLTVTSLLNGTIQNGGDYEVEYRLVYPDGSTRWVLTRGKGKMNEQGVVFRLSGVALDITTRRQAEDALQAAHQQSQQTNRIKDEFLATLSHELRSPLNAILGWANILRNNQLDVETQNNGLETIERNALSQARLIEDLLDVSRVLNGKMRLELHPVELARIVEDAVENAVPTAQTKQIHLVTNIDHANSLISGDPDRLSQVFWNLLSNAIKFTPNGGRVTVSLEVVDSQVQVKTSDTGRGIPPDFLPYVFDRFRQADASSTREQGGLGIGLGLVRHLVEAHGGSVRAESAGAGQGATFTLTFPLMAVQPESQKTSVVPLPIEPKIELLSPSQEVPMPLLAGLRILVVDDEADSRSLTAFCLQQRGAVVTTADSAASAFAFFVQSQQENRPFDLLISDIGMPGEDGVSLVQRIRTHENTAKGFLPAVALTAFAGGKDRLRVMLAGFQIHIAKPINPLELVVSVASLTGRTGRLEN